MPEGDVHKELPGKLQTVAVLVLRNNDADVLLVKHKAKARNAEGVYGFPAGQVRLGEWPTKAAARELEEETGLKTNEDNLAQYPGNYFSADLERHMENPEDSHVRRAGMTVYYCKSVSGELKENPETAPEWVPLSKVKGLPLLPNVNLALESYLDSKK